MDAGLVVADTDIVIDFLRGRGTGAEAVRKLIEEGRLRLTAVTAFEIRVGTDFLRRSEIGKLFGRRTLPVDAVGALHAGEAFVRLRAAGAEIGIKDCLQAGVCLRFDLPLATRNVRHFDRIPRLTLMAVG